MKIAAAHAIADVIKDDEVNADYVIPKPTDYTVYREVAVAVSQAAVKTGIARVKRSPEWVREHFQELHDFYFKNEDPMIDKRKIGKK